MSTLAALDDGKTRDEAEAIAAAETARYQGHRLVEDKS